mgnify:CR=1 FL=1
MLSQADKEIKELKDRYRNKDVETAQTIDSVLSKVYKRLHKESWILLGFVGILSKIKETKQVYFVNCFTIIRSL